jgi:hypothetical protein
MGQRCRRNFRHDSRKKKGGPHQVSRKSALRPGSSGGPKILAAGFDASSKPCALRPRRFACAHTRRRGIGRARPCSGENQFAVIVRIGLDGKVPACARLLRFEDGEAAEFVIRAVTCRDSTTLVAGGSHQVPALSVGTDRNARVQEAAGACPPSPPIENQLNNALSPSVPVRVASLTVRVFADAFPPARWP